MGGAGDDCQRVCVVFCRYGHGPAVRLKRAHGEPLYHFQGLRQYKDKFDPVWEARYLAYPGGLALPRVLTDITTLVSGGLRGVFMK